jgi:hypothetical protein
VLHIGVHIRLGWNGMPIKNFQATLVMKEKCFFIIGSRGGQCYKKIIFVTQEWVKSQPCLMFAARTR